MDGKKLVAFYFESKTWWILLVMFVLLAAGFLYSGRYDLASFFIVMTIVHFLLRLAHRLRKLAKEILTSNTLGQLIEKYLAFVLVTLLLFTILYSVADLTHLGYITYGQCSDDYVYGSVPPSHSYFYFSAVTMFTVGYGDLCPMGVSKGIAILNMLLGQMFTVVFLGAAIANIASRNDKQE